MAPDDVPDIKVESVEKTNCPQCGRTMAVSGRRAFTNATCPDCGAVFSVPGRLGEFVLLKVLGKGGMGITCKAFERGLGRQVAMKIMLASVARDPKRVEDFMTEARALASLDHPNVARAYSLGSEGGQPYIVMELVAGRRFDQLFSKDQPLDEGRALEIITDVAEALRAANGVGLIHGDVKPGNIVIDENGQAKLVDFGLARFGAGRVEAGAALGSPYYLAPEQLQRKHVDLRTDIYSLGVTLFQALAGVPPFQGRSVDDVLKARLARPAPDLRNLRPSINPHLAAVVRHMLQADPDKRYGNYDELLKDLYQGYREARHKPRRPAKPTAREASALALGQTTFVSERPKRPAPQKPKPASLGGMTTKRTARQVRSMLWMLVIMVLIVLGIIALIIVIKTGTQFS